MAVGIAVKNGAFGLSLSYGKPTFFTEISNVRTNCVSSTAVSTGTNYHLMGTYKASTGDLYLYVNGTQVATVNTGSTGQATDHNDNNFTIGSWDTSGNFFNGLISNVALYDAYSIESYAATHHGWNQS